MKSLLIILIVMLSWSVEASNKSEKTNEVEPRGKAKYALITNLAIVLAAKVGLYKLILAIALTVASLKILLIMVWVSAIYKYVPDPYLHYQKTGHFGHNLEHFGHNPEQFGYYHDKFSHHREGYQALDLIADFIKNRQRR
ncbi:hypothetical protein PYW08_006643 [Mythimna loreyi]|uniref:Uncharacterized protein n=1 Tax=Mythimna loreyi TaxID=667449 RepID=A0ACC2R7M1_9NEOP|nr:hypothetical protein PYW08_006643 [Mythimna loreyi]